MGVITIILIIVLVAAFFCIIVLRRKLASLRQDEIKKSEGRRSAFVSIISHQLRTPLSIIKGYLEALLTGDQGDVTDGQKEYLGEALDINLDTIKMVNDYLQAVNLDSENIEVNPESVDLTKIVEKAIRRLSSLAKASNCELIFIKSPKLVPQVHADVIKIKQVVENTITNAIKYIGGKGKATLAVSEEDGQVLFSCQDTGVGIPKDQQDEIFTKFFRARNVINKDTKGSGLGLYLSKMIIDALGGKIWLKSEEGKGTTIFFTLPKDNS